MRKARKLLIGLAIAALLVTGCEWSFETLDGQGGADGRTFNSVGSHNTAVLYNGRPHIFYWDNTDSTLRHAYYNGSFWAFETLDGNGGPNGRVNTDVGEYGAAILYNGRPHVFYRSDGLDSLRHAYYNGSAWIFETLDGMGGPNGRVNTDVGWNNSVVLYNGRPHVFYYDSTDDTLRHAYYNGVAWAFEILDGNGGPNGRVVSNVGEYGATILYNGRPHVFYHADALNSLRHAYYNGTTWAFETLDGVGGPNGRINATVGVDNAAILYNGRPHAFYYDANNGNLRHAYYNGSAWGFETLDGAGGANGRINADVGLSNAVILYNGRPRVFSYDNTNGDLRQSYYNGSAWGFETLDGAGGANGRINGVVGQFNAAVLYNGRPHVFYWDIGNARLRHTYFG